MQGQPVQRLNKSTRNRSPEDLEAFRQRKGKRNKTTREERHEWAS